MCNTSFLVKQISSPETSASVNAWCNERPRLAEYFNSLNKEEISWGIFSNGAVQMLTRPDAIDVNDLDILVAEEQFEEAARLTPGTTVSRQFVDITSADGTRLRYPADEISTIIDGVPIQIMRSPAGIERDGGEHHYYLDMTELAAANRQVVPTEAADVVLANPLDTIMAKAILHRPRPKRDFEDAATLARKTNHDEEYFQLRAEELRVDGRALRFLGNAGLKLAIPA